jgi:hypothetical protein
VAAQERPGQAQARSDLGAIGRALAEQEARQRQQAVGVGAGPRPADRAARARRDVDQIGGRASHRAAREVESETELGEQVQLEPDVALQPVLMLS